MAIAAPPLLGVSFDALPGLRVSARDWFLVETCDLPALLRATIGLAVLVAGREFVTVAALLALGSYMATLIALFVKQ